MFHVSMQGNVDVSSNALHSAGFQPGGRETGVVYGEQPSRKRVGRSIGTSSAAYTLVHTHVHARTRFPSRSDTLSQVRIRESTRVCTRSFALSRCRFPSRREVEGTWVQRSLNHILCNITRRYTTDSRKCGQNLCVSRADTALKDGFRSLLARVHARSRFDAQRRAWTIGYAMVGAARTKRRGQIETFIAEVNALLATEKRSRSGTKFVLRLA